MSFFVASDPTPIAEFTQKVVFLNNEEIAVVTRNGDFQIKTIENEIQTPFIQELDVKIEAMEKGGYEYFMLKEIYDNLRRSRLYERSGSMQQKAGLSLVV